MQLVENRVLRTIAAHGIALVVLLLAATMLAAHPAYADEGAPAAGSTLQAGTAAEDEAAKAEAERIARMAVVKDGLYNLRSMQDTSRSVGIAGESIKAKAKAVPAERQLNSWSQKWIVVQDKKTGYYTIRNMRSRLFLTVSGAVGKNATINQMKQSNSTRQQWQLVKESGKFQLCSAANPKYALALISKKGVPSFALRAAKGAKAQQFKLNSVPAIEDGHSFFVRSAANSKKSLAIKGASKKAKAKVLLAKRSNAKTQKFRFNQVGKRGTTFTLQNVRSTLYVGASKAALTQTSGKKAKSKRWVVSFDLATATFTIKSATSGKFVDTTAGKLALRAKGASAAQLKVQRFVLVPTYGFSVFVDAGHGRNSSGWGVYDPGAQGSGRNEADLTKDLANRIVKNLADSDVRVFNGADNSVPYWQRNGKARSLGCDAIVSIHFDAGGGSSTSTMVGTSAASGSGTLNSIIHRKLVSSIGLRDGGTMHRSDITVVNGSVPSVLMEVCFIDNYSSLSKYLNRRSSVAKALADGIIEASLSPALQK